jgi:ribosome-binding protein aMBF1 (putative translation factor)
MTKRRGHYCRICGSRRPNEAFSGKGHRIHVCKQCARLPKEEREESECKDELFSYLSQSRISDKNVSHLRKPAISPNEQIAELAGIILQVAAINPYKKRRLKELAGKNCDLLHKLDETGLILAHGC